METSDLPSSFPLSARVLSSSSSGPVVPRPGGRDGEPGSCDLMVFLRLLRGA